jgi:hypothetical protein
MQAAVLTRADAIFAAIGNGVEKAGDLVMEGGKMVAKEIPEVAYQYVAYGRAINSLFLALAIAVFIVGYRIIRKLNFNTMEEGECMLRIFGGAIPMIISTICFFNTIKDFFMVWFAPKVWLMLEIADLVRKVRGH